MRPLIIAAAALALSGCATTYQLAVMPRDSGRIYEGVATDTGYGEGPVAITIEGRTYNGTWVQTVPERTYGYVSGGLGYGRRGWGMGGGFITMDNPGGGMAKALLTSPEGGGLRCDLQSGSGRGGGICIDDRGKMYDVQIRATRQK